METKRNINTVQFRTGLIALIIVSMHIALGLYVTFAPDHFIGRNKIVKIYKQLIVLGPFFTESRIKSSHYLSIQYKQNDSWSSSREFGREHFLLYSRNPWRYDKLPYNDYEKRLSYLIGKIAKDQPFDRVKKNSSFRELNEFILQEFIGGPVDSIRMVYALNQYIPKRGSYTLDTVFSYAYKPTTIGRAKK